MSREYDFSIFQDRLRQVLKEKNLTQVHAARLLGISKHTFTTYYKGRMPKSTVLLRMSHLFDKPMEWFLTEDKQLKKNNEDITEILEQLEAVFDSFTKLRKIIHEKKIPGF